MKKQNKLNLSQKFVILIILVSIIPLVALGIFSYKISARAIKKEIVAYTDQIMEEKIQSTGLLVNNIESLVKNIQSDPDIKAHILHMDAIKDLMEKMKMQTQVYSILSKFNNLQGIIAIDLIDKKNDIYHIGDPWSKGDYVDWDMIHQMEKELNISGKSIYWSGIEKNYFHHANNPFIVMIVANIQTYLPNLSQPQPIAQLIVCIQAKELSKLFQIEGINDQTFHVLDQNHQLIYASDPNLIGTFCPESFITDLGKTHRDLEQKINGKLNIIHFEEIPETNWSLLCFSPISAIQNKIAVIFYSTLGIILVILMLLGAVTMYIVRSYVDPINQITNRFKTRENQPTHNMEPLPDIGQDEIAELIRWFNAFIKSEEDKKILEEAKDMLMSTISHELRTPLTAIREGINIVLTGKVGEINKMQTDLLDTSRRNVDRLKRLITDVLDFQKLNSSTTTLNLKQESVNELVMEVSKSMNPMAVAKNLILTSSLEENLPDILFDRDKIIQVLTNLINNAIKFTDQGSVTLKTELLITTIKISVMDTGPGISKENLVKLFHYFSQLEMTGVKKTEGTGLGLAISKKIIELHKGKIYVESKEGIGSSFSFELPI